MSVNTDCKNYFHTSQEDKMSKINTKKEITISSWIWIENVALTLINFTQWRFYTVSVNER